MILENDIEVTKYYLLFISCMRHLARIQNQALFVLELAMVSEGSLTEARKVAIDNEPAAAVTKGFFRYTAQLLVNYLSDVFRYTI
jgi:hypothetical protein